MSNYPKASVVWPGAVLGTVVKSIATAVNAEFDTLQSLNENNYTVQSWDGRYGAISFQGPQGHLFHSGVSSIVGAFYSLESSRCPRVNQSCNATLAAAFRGCPEHHRALAEAGVLQFLLFEIHPEGPCATTAFWNSGDHLSAADSWDSVLENGAEIIDCELIEDPDQALAAWAEKYHLSDEQINLADSVYRRRMLEGTGEILLSDSEASYLASLSDDPAAYHVCKTSFADIRVIVP
jgi:hypothetical protein